MSVIGLNRAAKALAIESTLASNIPPITTANDVNATLGLALKIPVFYLLPALNVPANFQKRLLIYL